MRTGKTDRAAFLLVLAVLTFLLVSCGQQAGDQAESDGQIVNAKITGEFTATVQDFYPDYVLDNTTDQTVMLREFQSGPFLLHTKYFEKDIFNQLEKGKTYVFTVKDKDVGEITETQFDSGVPKTEVSIPLFDLKIEKVRLAGEEDVGTGAQNLQFVKQQK